jgi:hypothetical protein
MEKAIAELKDAVSENILQNDLRSLSLRLIEVEKKANSHEGVDVRSIFLIIYMF